MAFGVLAAMVGLVLVVCGPALAVAWMMAGWMDHLPGGFLAARPVAGPTDALGRQPRGGPPYR